MNDTNDLDMDPKSPDVERQIDELRERLRDMETERSHLVAERDGLLAKIHYLTQLLHGHVSEKRVVPNPTLLGLPVDTGATAVEAESKQSQREVADQERERRIQRKNAKKGRGADGNAKPKNGGGRRPVNRELTIKTEIVVVPADQRTGPDGTPLILLDYEISEREFYVPAGILRLITKREILGLPDTREEVIRAPLPPAIVPRGKYHDSVIIEMIVRKFSTGMPFYRVLQDLQAMGSDLSESQLSDLARKFSEFMAPASVAIRAQVLSESIAHIDETTLPGQDGGRYLWAVVAGGQVFFHVGGRGGDELRSILGLSRQKGPGLDDSTPQDRSQVRVVHAMADGFSVYDTVLKEAGIIRLSCWAHGRRGFMPYKAEPTIVGIIDAISALYHVESQAKQEVIRTQVADDAAIAVYARWREERSLPQLEEIKRLLVAAMGMYPPKTEQRKAIDYLLNRWDTFTYFATSGELPIDNNDAERALKMIVIGRKNWMFVGSEDAAPHMAHLFTLLESCRMQRIDPRAYLTHVVAQLHAGGVPAEQLTPRTLAPKFRMRDRGL